MDTSTCPHPDETRPHLDSASPAVEPIDWENRLRTAVEKTLEARGERRREREELAARRAAGLERRHAARLARDVAAAVIPKPNGRCRYLVDEGQMCPVAAVPTSTLCRPHLTAAARLALRLGLVAGTDRP
ncbi:hypothetical protein [Actinoplanes solisilvae]|uniref:hypothetical protein n=1 Tax=Actinoplanes solisilvae TaxID=2486853 RepID=UPI000FDAF2FC|nr:hypothetical protein [Actinoplanes solisilvae]